MKNNFRSIICGCWAVALVALAQSPAHAVDLPTPFTFDAGPLGTIQVSGGADGYVYALTGAGSDSNKGLLGTSTSEGIQFLNGLLKVEKTDGLLRFTIEAGAVNSLTLGGRPKAPTVPNRPSCPP